MYITIGDTDIRDTLDVQALGGDLMVEQVTRTNDLGGYITVTVTLKDELAHEEEVEDEEEEDQEEWEEDLEYTQGYGPRLGSDVEQAYDKGYEDGLFDAGREPQTDDEYDEECRLCEIAEAYKRGRASAGVFDDSPDLATDEYEQGYEDGLRDGVQQERARGGQNQQATVADRTRQPDYGTGLYGVSREGTPHPSNVFGNRR